MDIYDYINSRDVAAYCREIGKTWTPFEMAVIIGRCDHRTMADKHTAWCELMNDYPDMPTPKNMHHRSYTSLHEKLTEVIDYEERQVAVFKKPETNAVYTYKVWWNKEYSYSESVFLTLEEAIINAQEHWEREECTELIMMKMYAGDKGTIESRCDYDGNIRDISCSGDCLDLFDDINFSEFIDFGENFYIDVPTPFKHGDILKYADERENKDKTVFVLKSLSYDDERLFKLYQSGEFGDGSDLMCWGYFVGGNGFLYGDHVMYHDGLEYYRGELQGKQRLLKYVSLYMKESDHLDLPSLLTLQCRIMLENLLDEDLRLCTHGLHLSLDIINEESKKAGRNDKK